MVNAFDELDKKLKKPANLLLGGGGAMVLAYDFPLATHDLDAVFYKSSITLAEIGKEIADISKKLSLPPDWINPYFDTFLYTLPKDYEARLKTIFKGKNLIVNALGLEDLLILKCFAGRDKDIPHARALIKKGAKADFATQHIEGLILLNIPKAKEAKQFLYDLLDELDVSC